MTRTIRESDRHTLFMEVFTQHTAIMDNKTGELSNWNTGAEALKETKMLIGLAVEEFDKYCEQVKKD